MSAHDLDTRARRAAAALHRSVAEAELSAAAPAPARRGPGWLVVAALVVVVVLGGALVLLRDGDGSNEGGIASTGQPTRLAPTELPDGMAFTGAFEGLARDVGGGPVDVTIYAGPVGSNVVVLGNAFVDPTGTRPGGDPEIATDLDVHSATWFDEATGRTIALSAQGVTAEQMRAIAEGTTTDDHGTLTIAEEALPGGVTRIGVVPVGVATPSVSTMASIDGAGGVGYADEGQERVLEVGFAVAEPRWLEAAAARMVDARAVEVRGQPGFGGGAGPGLGGTTLAWVEPDGTFVRLVGWGLSVDELAAIAETLEPLTDEEWQALLEQSDRRSADDDGISSSGSTVESAVTSRDVGEPIERDADEGPLPRIALEAAGEDSVVVYLINDPEGAGTDLTSLMEVHAEDIDDLPIRIDARSGLLVGIAPADTARITVRFDGNERTATERVHASGTSRFTGVGFALPLGTIPTSLEVELESEDGTVTERTFSDLSGVIVNR